MLKLFRFALDAVSALVAKLDFLKDFIHTSTPETKLLFMKKDTLAKHLNQFYVCAICHWYTHFHLYRNEAHAICSRMPWEHFSI